MNIDTILNDIGIWVRDDFWHWLTHEGLEVAAILIAITLVRRFSTAIIGKTIRKTIQKDQFATKQDEVRREDTLISIISATLRIALWVLGAMLILDAVGFNIGPLLAGAGIVGLAVGFGAQTLVKDFVSGLFIVMENQYRVGDVITINGVSGTVHEITMRTTVLRDLDGQIHHITNGSIEHSTNMTFEYSGINMIMGVGYDTDLDEVEKIINDVGAKLAKDKDWKAFILNAPEFKRINEFADSSVNLLILGTTTPGNQWMVAGELRKRLKIAFDAAGIEIPFPQRVVETKVATKKKTKRSTKKS